MRVVALVVPLLLTAACSGGRGEVRVLEYRLLNPTTLQIVVDACRGNAEVEDLEETASEVRIAVVATRPGWFGSGSCAEALDVPLQRGLGARTVVDVSSGSVVRTP
jgi:hypothetical protein